MLLRDAYASKVIQHPKLYSFSCQLREDATVNNCYFTKNIIIENCIHLKFLKNNRFFNFLYCCLLNLTRNIFLGNVTCQQEKICNQNQLVILFKNSLLFVKSQGYYYKNVRIHFLKI